MPVNIPPRHISSLLAGTIVNLKTRQRAVIVYDIKNCTNVSVRPIAMRSNARLAHIVIIPITLIESVWVPDDKKPIAVYTGEKREKDNA